MGLFFFKDKTKIPCPNCGRHLRVTQLGSLYCYNGCEKYFKLKEIRIP